MGEGDLFTRQAHTTKVNSLMAVEKAWALLSPAKENAMRVSSNQAGSMVSVGSTAPVACSSMKETGVRTRSTGREL